MQNFRITFNLYCTWEHYSPIYRLYFDDELMAERTYAIDDDKCIQEMVPVYGDIDAPHTIRIEQLSPQTGKFTIEDLKGCLNIKSEIV